jgi:hypothetical protein
LEGAAGTAEAAARAKYTAEFELFGDQIREVAKQVDPRILSTAKGWKDVVAYVRGQDDNVDKLIEFKSNGGKPSREVARSEQIVDTGFTARPARGSSGPVNTHGLDEVQRKIAETQNPHLPPEKAYAEYKKWSQE